jgi:four helix bundle protein
MQSPNKLRVFGEAEELALRVYHLVKSFPAEERFGLTQQLRRAAVSVGSNIAEGCGRGSGNRELLRFLSIALGSVTELEFQLRIAFRLSYLSEVDHAAASEHARRVQRMLTLLILKLRPALEASRGRP